jgi:hypothetical protein
VCRPVPPTHWNTATATNSSRKAHERIAAHPDRYIDHVYGEFENGGTSYLILSHIPFSELGLPSLPETPVNEVSEKVMEMTIPFALGWGAVLSGVAAGWGCLQQKEGRKSRRRMKKRRHPNETQSHIQPRFLRTVRWCGFSCSHGHCLHQLRWHVMPLASAPSAT